MALGASQHQVHVQSPGWMNRELMLDVDTVFFLFCFVLFTLVHFISVSFCGLALLHLEKKKKRKKNRQKRKSRWYVLHSVGTVDVNVCTLYSTFINTCRAISLGENIEVYEIVPLFFYVKKIEK